MAKHNKHRKPPVRRGKKLAAGAGITGAAMAIPLFGATSAQAAPLKDWDRIAHCEADSLWHRSDGHASSTGGLQFQSASWMDAIRYLERQGIDTSNYPKNSDYAANAAAYLATKEQQILAGEALLAMQGSRAWAVTYDANGAAKGCHGALSSGSLFKDGPNPFGSTPLQTIADGGKVNQGPNLSPHNLKPALGLVNDARTEAGLDPLVLDEDLMDFAQDWADQQAEDKKMKHSDMDFPGSPRGENVAKGQDDIAEVIDDWMNSEGHRKNILHKDFTKMGIAIAHDSNGEHYWAQVFAGGEVATPDPDPEPEPEPEPEPGDGEGEDPAPEPSEDDVVHTVVKGDTLWDLSGHYYEDPTAWRTIYQANTDEIEDPHWIYPGETFVIPGTGEGSGEPTPSPEPEPEPEPTPEEEPEAPSVTHKVAAGDTLFRLADHYLGDGEKWQEIFEANKPPMHSDPDSLEIGWELVIPNPVTTEPLKPLPKPAAAAGWVSPIAVNLTGAYGQSGSWALGYHTGADFAAADGTPVRAVADAKVVATGGAGQAYGIHVVLQLPDGKYALYAHLSSRSVSVGDTVKAGQTIGAVGSTGNSSGPHLHFEIRNDPTQYFDGNFTNPVDYLRSKGVNL